MRRQATLSPEEADGVLIEHDRLDGWVNFAYRALKNDRDGRPLEARLDAAESVPWLLDVVFAIAGRVRPYNKYLPWELRTHPLDGWPADDLLALVRAHRSTVTWARSGRPSRGCGRRARPTTPRAGTRAPAT